MVTAERFDAGPREGRWGRFAEFLQRALPELREASPWDERPIREELFGVDRLEEQARTLAPSQSITTRTGLTARLLRRLDENERVLVVAYRDVADAITSGAAITPAAEWLIDNFHLVEAQIREIRLDLPSSYYRQLPKLATGPFAGLPRVFGLAWSFVAHTDSLFDPDWLRRYVRAYQEVQPLSIGELWAVAITLRVMLVENLRRISGRVVASRAGRRLADAAADRLLGSADHPAEPPLSVLGPLRSADLSEAFFVQLVQRLRDQDPSIAPALTWIDERLAERRLTADGVVQAEHQRQVAAGVTVRNIITSMRLVSDVDWSELFERMSLVDDVLGAHAGYGLMDFPTRNLYRSAIEDLARGSKRAELDVARAALLAASAVGPADEGGEDNRLRDPGYYLIAAGRRRFETAIGYRALAARLAVRVWRALGIGGYVGAGAILASLLLAAPLVWIATGGAPWPWLVALAVLGVAPAVDLSVALVNHLVTQGFRATLLPALALKEGVPPDLRTMVVVPTLLTSVDAARTLAEQLEIHHLASPGGEISFALLTDWIDAPTEHVEGDETLLAAARDAVTALNRRYGPAPGGARFMLLHRRRVWSDSEQRWMGWERKRGKLAELNRLLRGATDTTYLDPPPVPAGIRYVVTLDSDTRLPRETVRRLIGKMAHPLNRPRFDADARRVVEGYAILQPRVTPSLPVGREGSLFLRVFTRASGIDPYAAAVSDVYQDLFGEGSYTGKGVYDVDVFEAALAGRAPEASLLSHDLFEGVFARAGLASDVEVIEDFPARYDQAALRHHRWARGDWQLLPWMLGLGPRPPGPRTGTPWIGRWKMLDNVRRSLSAPSTVAALLAGWAAPGDAAFIWTGFIVATMGVPPLLPVIADLTAGRPNVHVQGRWRTTLSDLIAALAQIGLMLDFLGHQAWLMSDAILRTLVRLAITRRRLLEWTPAAQAAFGPNLTLGAFFRRMSGALVLAAVAVVVAWLGAWRAWPIAGAFAAAWALSPAVAFRASLSPRAAGATPPGEADARSLRRIARRTWRFFETFVTADNQLLPPDNFQETPKPVVAQRTSPTNIGLYLLATVCARDFGWIGEMEALSRLEGTFGTLTRMERFRGHFYNWYDTRDLHPLEPRYVSSVDSGNLAGHLIALAGACRDWQAKPLAPQARAKGCADALGLARQALEALPPARSDVRRRLAGELDVLEERLAQAGDGRWDGLAAEIDRVSDVARQVAIEEGDDGGEEVVRWVESARRSLDSHRADEAVGASDRTARLTALGEGARSLALGMDFAFLLDPNRLLLSIGYQSVDNARDPSCYDLLASEARLASFIAIAKGDAPTRHWFRLGRSVAPTPDGPALISWSGSMFEYLMPSLVMRAPAASLIEQTNRVIVARQVDYGRRIGAPWGVSESAFNARDLELTYQYSNFGVPGLGLKRGLADNRVVAPYATALAAMVQPEAAARNFERLADLKAQGRYGFYEAVDFTPSRVPEGEHWAIVQAYMAHHQGMSICAIADVLLDGALRDRFHDDPIVQATELLLQERAPREVIAAPPSVAANASAIRDRSADGGWRRASPWSATPDAQLLSNGRYTVMLTAAGSGYSAWRDLAITRWREDATCDDWGAFIYLRDVRSGEVWSAGLQPTGAPGQEYSVVFNEDRVQVSRRDGTIATNLETLVSAEDDAEVRRLTLTNFGGQTREIEATSFAELVLARQADDQSHPAFSKMFVETEYQPGVGALIAHRRRRTPDEPEVWAAHVVAADGQTVGRLQYETDRARFLGRGVGVRAPAAIVGGRQLSGTVGAVLDPIFAIRRRVRLEPGKSARLDFWTMAAPSRAEVMDLVDKHQDPGAFERAGTLAWTQVQVQLRHLGVTHGQAGQFQRLAGHLIYSAPTMRPLSEAIEAGRGGQPLLWSLGVSGDLPIVLVKISDGHEIDLVREALLAVEYLRIRRLAVDLVVLNERQSSYIQDLQSQLETLVRANQSRPQIGEERAEGHTFLLRSDLIAADAREMLNAAARVVLTGDRGRLEDQVERAPEIAADLPQRAKSAERSELQVGQPSSDLDYFNGLGGFSKDGKEYVITIEPGQATPAPWINVIANPTFGFQVSAEGGGYAWRGNSREHQITPWSNDPVTDEPSQALFVRDDESGELWSPTAQPLRNPAAPHVARHGFGYSRFSHASAGVALELTEFAPLEDPVRIGRLVIRNTSARRRRLSVTAYAEWSLGASRTVSAPHVATLADPTTGAIFASNRWNPTYAERVAFFDLGGRQTSVSGDRREFIGRNRSLAAPAALSTGAPLSGRLGCGLDPCGALRASVELPPGASAEFRVLLGEADGEDEARRLVARWRSADLGAELVKVRERWDRLTSQVRVKTPDQTMDLMLNGWLVYQAIASRLWARAGFYQASGAYGFRDQLQDVMGLATVDAALAREQLLRAASRQFVEGDVQHWWLPETGQGIRTRISDDRVWLAYVTLHYLDVTDDAAILDEAVPFVTGPLLEPGQAESFYAPETAPDEASFYEHCARGLDGALAAGAHGAPLMGSGDWNDGMNRVGAQGRGESVWLGWFLLATLPRFADLATSRGDSARAAAWRDRAASLREALEREAWDGDWYRRAWFDDGAPLGSAANEECRIDSIAQSWGVLSGGADPDRAARAMAALERELVRPEENVALVFTPPFDGGRADPGYVKAYPPGVRENGGQYTHASVWATMAFAALGEGDKAAALFWILNPVNHARTRSDAYRYRVEPYVVAADIYSGPGRTGRGGWTWYTGSAAWLQRAGVESILGLRARANYLEIDPCVPRSWPRFEAVLKRGAARYEVSVDNPSAVSRGVVAATIDGRPVEGRPVRAPFVDDGQVHKIEVTLG